MVLVTVVAYTCMNKQEKDVVMVEVAVVVFLCFWVSLLCSSIHICIVFFFFGVMQQCNQEKKYV